MITGRSSAGETTTLWRSSGLFEREALNVAKRLGSSVSALENQASAGGPT
jgi:hypothetical protein